MFVEALNAEQMQIYRSIMDAIGLGDSIDRFAGKTDLTFERQRAVDRLPWELHNVYAERPDQIAKPYETAMGLVRSSHQFGGPGDSISLVWLICSEVIAMHLILKGEDWVELAQGTNDLDRRYMYGHYRRH